ncbi:Membrane associated eicosanoid/glutathione metabolism-like domain-containing protein [Heracleum sosnowskyi]|uniref:Glutathione S-transferase 3, mitochondrial n=1 Tax=Heracleum sosnowskyi TaxID=360622 RepID=A0AAD8NBY8_9APIA|nr:Membrane associated eicosanoid/glutathione metabolism-like domain-containing protein [Heracleum sosnowskyi]
MAGVEMLPKEYGYVVLILSFSGFFNFWMASQVGKARIKYNVPYPALYALESENKDANIFNCIQRGHQNSLEWMPLFFTFMVVGGIKHPIISAALGFVYIVARYFYFTGYSSGDPKKRLTIGKFNFLALVGLILCSVSCGISFLLA